MTSSGPSTRITDKNRRCSITPDERAALRANGASNAAGIFAGAIHLPREWESHGVPAKGCAFRGEGVEKLCDFIRAFDKAN